LLSKEKKTMTMNIITFLHVVSAQVAIASGAKVWRGLISGELLAKWAVRFLRCSLVASLIGLLIPLHPFLPIQAISMLSVYVSGTAILAWRRYHLAGAWRSIFALTATIVLYLNVAVVVAQGFKLVIPIMALTPASAQPAFLVTQFLVMAVLVVLGILAVKGFQNRPVHWPTHSF
jgi:hypothetical protein